MQFGLIMERDILKLLQQELLDPEKNWKHAVDVISHVGGGGSPTEKLFRLESCLRACVRALTYGRCIVSVHVFSFLMVWCL